MNVGKNKVMALGREEGSLCKVTGDGSQFENVLEFKYLGFVLHVSGSGGAECCRKVSNEKKLAGEIRSFVNVKSQI